MSAKVVAIIGTYRKNHVSDTAVSHVLESAERQGAKVHRIYLIDRHIEFCTNCRACTQQQGDARGKCPIDDDMSAILDRVESADALVLASPVNFFSVTAVTKRFQERLVCYAYWPWESGAPKFRMKKATKPAVIVTSAACPAPLARILIRGSIKGLKSIARCVGARVVKTLYFGMVATTPQGNLTQKERIRCRNAGFKLINSARGSDRPAAPV